MMVLSRGTLLHAGVCSLGESTSSMAKVAKWTMLYYALTTVAAVLLGILLVTVIKPGQGSPFSGNLATNCHANQVGVCHTT